MSVGYRFHPEAGEELDAAVSWYSVEASKDIADAFVSVIEAAVLDIVRGPDRWRIIEEPGIRRYVCSRFPFAIYYRQEDKLIVVYAVMHCSRKPGYWKRRLK